jgi:hypothetical protein
MKKKDGEPSDEEQPASSYTKEPSRMPEEEMKHYRMPEEEAQKLSRKVFPNPYGSHTLTLR